MTDWSKALGSTKCSKCGRLGQYKLRGTYGMKTCQVQVDHYKNNNHNKYLGNCHLGSLSLQQGLEMVESYHRGRRL
jgi:hypothetical protein